MKWYDYIAVFLYADVLTGLVLTSFVNPAGIMLYAMLIAFGLYSFEAYAGMRKEYEEKNRD